MVQSIQCNYVDISLFYDNKCYRRCLFSVRFVSHAEHQLSVTNFLCFVKFRILLCVYTSAEDASNLCNIEWRYTVSYIRCSVVDTWSLYLSEISRTSISTRITQEKKMFRIFFRVGVGEGGKFFSGGYRWFHWQQIGKDTLITTTSHLALSLRPSISVIRSHWVARTVLIVTHKTGLGSFALCRRTAWQFSYVQLSPISEVWGMGVRFYRWLLWLFVQ